MVTLVCALVGVKGNAFSIDIDASKLVDHLKKAIKKEKENKIKCDADELELFLAKNADNAWLESSTDVVKLLKKGEKTALIEALTHEDNELDGEFGFEEVLEGMPEPKTKQIHVLVVVPEGATSEHDSLALLREASVRQMRLEMQLEQLVASLPHKPSKSYSDAALGQLELGRLKKDQLIIEVAPTGDGEAFWSEEVQIQVNAIMNEAVFDAFITPFFNTILHSCGLVFVNSERYQWLSQSSDVTKNTDLKPNGFATHRGMFRGKPIPNDGVLRPSGFQFRFGVAEEELFDCLILFEASSP